MALMAALSLACGGGGTTQVMPAAAPVALFTAPAPGIAPDLRTVPWPSDLYLDASGHVAVGSYYPLQDASIDAILTADLARHSGFSVAAGAFFPTSIAADAASLDGRIELVDLEGDCSPASAIPVQALVRAEEQLIFARPRWGHTLLEKHRYAYLLRQGITAGGQALAAAADTRAVLAATSRPADPALARAWDVLAPLRARPACLGDPASVIAASVFTTQPVTGFLADARALLHGLPAPAARPGYVFAATPRPGDAGSLDDLLGKPAQNRPGLDNAGGIAHDGIAFVVQGTFESPDFLSASTPTGSGVRASATLAGHLHVDAAGKAAPLGTATIPFTLVLPAGTRSLADLPCVVYQHGLGASRLDVMAIANTVASAGFAFLGIEIPFHGARQATAVDLIHNFTKAAGPDGFAETTVDSSYLFFDIFGDKARGVASLDPTVIRAAFQQAAIDLMAEVRLVTAGDWSGLAMADDRLAGLSFRKGRIVYTGESFGSILGGIVIAMEPDVGAAVLSVGGGGLIAPLLVWSVDFAPIFQSLLDITLATNASVSPVESDFGYNLFQFLIETGDPIAYAPYVIGRPLAGAVPRHVVMLNAYADEAVPNIANEHLAGAMGLSFGQLALGGAPRLDYIVPAPSPVAAPISGNLTVGGQKTTAVMVQFGQATHIMITRQRGQRTHDTRKRPFAPLAAPVTIDNPIEALQGILVGVARDFYAGRTPTVADLK